MNELVDCSLSFCRSWLVESESNGLRLIDPIDQRAIKAHYGDSHLAAALIILGQARNDQYLVDLGVRLISTVLREWNDATELRDFHHDFNNFALCLIEERLAQSLPDTAGIIRTLVLSTRDSSHDTVNWLPMRAYVNQRRLAWTGERQHERAFDRCIRLVRKATNADGGIEDRLPGGSSYNLQYNVSSLAGLQFLSSRAPAVGVDLQKSLAFLMNHVLPDGDINYVGRGTNQLFAWGPWLYLLSAAQSFDALDQALEFLTPRYLQAGAGQNILLNGFPGPEKLFWWDYHYCTVYHAHFLLWSVLALSDAGQVVSDASPPSPGVGRPARLTGLTLERDALGGVVIFAGRGIYLAEAGPSICAVWIAGAGLVFKGGRGPWQGLFGKTYSFADLVLQNHFGLVSQSAPRSPLDSRVGRVLVPGRPEGRISRLEPVLADIDVKYGVDSVIIDFNGDETDAYLNAPIFEQASEKVSVEFSVDGERIQSILVGRLKGQYGWNNVWRSRAVRGKNWRIKLEVTHPRL